jgi:hypothetical protein
VWRTEKVYTGVWLGYLRERYHLEETAVRLEENIKMDIQEFG